MSERMVGELRVLQRLNQYEMAVELDFLRTGLIHVGGTVGGDGPQERVENWEYRNLDRYYKTFAGKPLLIAYVGNRVGDGHNSETRIDRETGEAYQSYMSATSERIVGTVSEDESDLTLEERDDGYTWARAKGRIWTNYAPELTEKLVRTGRMSVSVETNVLESRVEGTVEVMENWIGLGITLLNEGVAPAVPGANVRALAAMQEEFEEMKLRVAAALSQEGSEKEKPTAIEADKKVEKQTVKGVRKLMNKTLKKELDEKFPAYFVEGATEDGLSVALLSRDGMYAYCYTFEDSDRGNVVEDRIQAANLSASMTCGEKEIPFDLSDMVGQYDAQIARLSAENEALTKRCETMEAQIRTSEAKEHARRVKASRDAALRQLADINANRGEGNRFADELISGILKRCEDGDFIECEDSEGDWDGDEAACAAVRDVCMKQQMEMDKRHQESLKAASTRKYPWESGFTGQSASGNAADALISAMQM